MRRENKAIFRITVSWEYILFSVKGRLLRGIILEQQAFWLRTKNKQTQTLVSLREDIKKAIDTNGDILLTRRPAPYSLQVVLQLS